MYKKIIFSIQVALLLVFAKETLQAQAFNFVYIDSAYAEPYLNNVTTLFNWYAIESEYIEMYEVEKSTDLVNWSLLERKGNNTLYTNRDNRILYRSFDRMASLNAADTTWYRIKAISKLGYYMYDAPPIPHKPLAQHISVHPYISEKRILKYNFEAIEMQENIQLILIHPVTLKEYIFDKPLAKGFQQVAIPKEWQLEKGVYILKVKYKEVSPWLNTYHKVLIL